MPSVKKNFFFNIILTVSTYFFSLIVFPYVSRVLGVELIGRVSFAQETVKYFMLFAVMGAATVGIREISACGEDRRKRSEVFSNIFTIILMLTAVSTAALVALIFLVPRLMEIKDLLVIGSFTLVFTSFLIEWFYQGLENFRYVTIRTIAVKILYVAAVFLFVKKPEDYVLYYAINMFCVVLNAVINLTYARKFVDFSFRGLKLRNYLRPVMSLGIYMLALSLFTTFNMVYLGFVQTETQTGLYAAAIKIYSILLAVISAFAGVMLPRMSSLISVNKIDEFKSKLLYSWELLFAFAFPIAIGGAVLAPELIAILSGADFMDAVLPMRIIMINLVVVGAAQIWVMQILLPMKKDRVVTISALAAAVVGILVNVFFVKEYGAKASAVSLVVAEIVGDAISLVYVIKHKMLSFPARKFVKFLLLSVPYVAICYFSTWLPMGNIPVVLIAFAACLAYFVVMNRFFVRDTQLSAYIQKITG